MIRLDDEQYWLYAAVNPESNELLHTKLEPTRIKIVASNFVRELREKHDVDDAVFLIDGELSLQYACERHGLKFRYERYGDRNSVERVFHKIKQKTTSFSNCFSNAEATTVDQWLKSFAFAWNQLILTRPATLGLKSHGGIPPRSREEGGQDTFFEGTIRRTRSVPTEGTADLKWNTFERKFASVRARTFPVEKATMCSIDSLEMWCLV